MDKEPKLYEIGYLLKGDLNEEKTLELSEHFRSLIEKERGIITGEGKPKKQSLAYPIRKQEAAFWGWFKVLLPAESLSDIKKSLEKTDILRFLMVEIKREKEATKPISKPKRVKRIIPKFIQKEEIPPRAGERLQVEEIDKKLEEILGA
jgi:ribosomal protein S6